MVPLHPFGGAESVWLMWTEPTVRQQIPRKHCDSQQVDKGAARMPKRPIRRSGQNRLLPASVWESTERLQRRMASVTAREGLSRDTAPRLGPFEEGPGSSASCSHSAR